MSLAALIRDMAAAGATPEAIAIAVEAVEATRAEHQPNWRASARAEGRRRKRDGEPTNPRAMGVNPRALGTNPRAGS